MAAIAPQPIPFPIDNTEVPIEFIWRLSVEQYHAMIQAGILTEDDPVELLAGWLVAKMPKNPRHSLMTQLVQAALTRALPDYRQQQHYGLSDAVPGVIDGAEVGRIAVPELLP
jgi:hypothetical protein